MATLTHIDDGTPIWLDASVSTLDEHHELRAFLSRVFDWTWDVGGPEMGHYSQALHDGQPVMGLGVNDQVAGDLVTYFATSDVAASVVRATELGAATVFPTTAIMDLGTMALLTDPLGALFGLWQPGTFAGFGVAYEANAPGWFDHVSGDPERAATFYSGLLGHSVISPDPAMRILVNDEQWFASLSHPQVDVTPRWIPIVVVDSLERVREVVPRHGGAILVEEMPVPGSAVCIFREPVKGMTLSVMRGGEQPA